MKKLKTVGKRKALQKTKEPEAVASEGLAQFHKSMCQAFCVADLNLAHVLLSQAGALQVAAKFKMEGEKLVTALAFIEEVKPASVLEASLAVQMLGVHHAALVFLTRATLAGQTPEGSDANVARAVRLLRLFNEQLEAMARLKGKAGQQKVTVEHVHVHKGGQAIVGTVNPSKDDPGGGGK